MSEVIFDILSGPPYQVQVSGSKIAPNSGGIYDSPDLAAILDISLTNSGGFTLYTGASTLNKMVAGNTAILPPGIANTDASPYICCEVINSTGSDIASGNLRLITSSGNVIAASSANLPDTESFYFLIQNPISETLFSPLPCPNVDYQLYGFRIEGVNRAFFFSIDGSTGSYQFLPGASNFGANGVAFDCENSIFYLITGDGNLHHVNISTGTRTLVGNSGTSGGLDLTYDSSTSTLFGHNASGGLYTIDETNGTWTLVPTTGLGNVTYLGLCYNCRNNLLYATVRDTNINTTYFCSFDKGTSSYTIIDSIENIQFLEYDSVNDRFYGTRPNAFFIIDYLGNTMQVGDTQIQKRGIALVTSRCCLCVSEGTLVNSDKQMIRIENLKAGCFVKSSKGKRMKIIDIVENGRSKNFVCISKNAFGEDRPYQDLLIKSGHPVLIDGKEIPCEELINEKNVREIEIGDVKRIFTLVTRKRSFVEMNGIFVGTWSKEDFENFCEKQPGFRFRLNNK